MKLFWLLSLFAIGLAGCGGAALQPKASATRPVNSPTPSALLPDLGPAPELTNTVWLNTDHPLRLADLRGKVVLLDMWTFECINCQHVIPSLRNWYNQYKDQGLVIIGNHFPEFAYERDLNNLVKAVADLNVPYPVDQDNDGATWNAYHNQYWPTMYLIDKRGHLRYTRIGEGGYATTESAIRTLLAESYP